MKKRTVADCEKRLRQVEAADWQKIDTAMAAKCASR